MMIGTPFIPSQRLEALLGFDVEFRLKQGNIQHSLFLQHKVSSFVPNQAGKNWGIYNFHGGPYYYFYLEKLERSRQHNLLYHLRQSGEDAYYSAPLFFQRNNFVQHFVNNVVVDNSVFIDPYGVGLIADLDLHKISYNQKGTNAAFHSEIREIRKPLNFKVLSGKIEERKIDEMYLSKLLARLKKGLIKVFQADVKLPEKYIDLPPVSQCIYLLRKYYKLQWIMF
jgi:hypothetical protein